MRFDTSLRIGIREYKVSIAGGVHAEIRTSNESKYITRISMAVWQKDNPISLGFVDRSYFNWETILPDVLAIPLVKRQLRRHHKKLNKELKQRGYKYRLKINFG